MWSDIARRPEAPVDAPCTIDNARTTAETPGCNQREAPMAGGFFMRRLYRRQATRSTVLRISFSLRSLAAPRDVFHALPIPPGEYQKISYIKSSENPPADLSALFRAISFPASLRFSHPDLPSPYFLLPISLPLISISLVPFSLPSPLHSQPSPVHYSPLSRTLFTPLPYPTPPHSRRFHAQRAIRIHHPSLPPARIRDN